MTFRHRAISLFLPVGVAVLLTGCSHNSGGAAIVPQTKAQETAARVTAITNNPNLSPQEKQQQIERLQAEAGS